MKTNDLMLSLLIPCYNEEDSIAKLYKEIKQNVEKLLECGRLSKYEIVFVSDGSTDETAKEVKKIILKDKHVKLIELRRNFGKSKVLQIGFLHVNGDVVMTMDADLQDDPKEISRFLDKLEEGYDIVSGWKKVRNDPLEKRLPSKLFNWVTSKLSGINIHDFNCGFKAYRREVVKNVKIYGEFHRYIPVLANRYGFKSAEIEVTHHKREFGHSKFGTERYLRGMFDAISALFLLKYKDRPMYLFGKIGLMFFLIGFLICSYLTIIWFMGESIGTRPLLILGVLLIVMGIQFISSGLVANILADDGEAKENQEVYIKEITNGGKNETI